MGLRSSRSSISDSQQSQTQLKSPIAKRLRSRSSTTVSEESFEKEKPRIANDDQNIIQIPTKTLNKVLTAITNSPDVGVAVKESMTKRAGDLEDISFTVELSSKTKPEETVLAKVFPEQGSCLVDKTIVSFLEDGSNQQVNNLVNNIVYPETPRQGKSKKDCLIDKLQNTQDVNYDPRNPEQLLRMDGKEISVED